MRVISISGGSAGLAGGEGSVDAGATEGSGELPAGRGWLAAGAGFLAMETLALAVAFEAAVGRAAGRARPDGEGAGAFRETFLGGAFAAAFFDIGQPSLRFCGSRTQ